MQITVKGKNFEVTEALRNYAEDRVHKVVRYFAGELISADVTMTTERNWHIVEVTVHGNGFDMRGEERTKDMYNSVDRVIDKLERQLKKQKGKEKNYRPSGEVAEAVQRTSSRPDKHAEYAPRIEHTYRFVASPMTVEEAIKELEAHGHQFFTFLNSFNSRINVVYKRERGYGLIDPRVEEED
ncbi:MAG: ribosome-associated translation inhibitor RaiA [Candidatus Eremiobacterota bacterium]